MPACIAGSFINKKMLGKSSILQQKNEEIE